MGLFSAAKEQWQFGNERDPDLWDREKDDWRAAKAAKEAGKEVPPRGSKGGKGK
jgi:hypothetical protein